MAIPESEAILSRIHARLDTWRGGELADGALGAIADDFDALKAAAAKADLDHIAQLCDNLMILVRQGAQNIDAAIKSGDGKDDDSVALLNLLEEAHDGLAAGLGINPDLPDHVKALNAMISVLLSGTPKTHAHLNMRDTPPAPSAILSPPPTHTEICAFADILPSLQTHAAQLAAARNIEVEVSWLGDIDIDRQVADAVRTIFEELIANSIAHAPDQKRLRIAISIGQPLAQRGAEWAVEYADDGGGVAREKIAAKAGEVNDAQILQVISASPNNPNNMANSPSGLAKVRGIVGNLGGLMAMQSGKSDRDAGGMDGLRFQFQLPTVLNAHRALLVAVGKFRLAIRAHAIERLLRVRIDKIIERGGRRFIDVGARAIPLIDLRAHIEGVGHGGDVGDVNEGAAVLALIRLADRIVAFEVDRLDEIVGIAPAPNPPPTAIRGGYVMLADSSMVVLLDLESFIDRQSIESHGLVQFPLGNFTPPQADVKTPLKTHAPQVMPAAASSSTSPPPLHANPR